jgi:hypothetical protein
LDNNQATVHYVAHEFVREGVNITTKCDGFTLNLVFDFKNELASSVLRRLGDHDLQAITVGGSVQVVSIWDRAQQQCQPECEIIPSQFLTGRRTISSVPKSN